MHSADLPLEQHRNNLLYDFYGALLTEHQRGCFTMHHMEDCSLAEIGAEMGITPQAVSDMLKRTVRKLEKYEEKLGLVAAHLERQKNTARLREEINNLYEPKRTTLLQLLDAII